MLMKCKMLVEGYCEESKISIHKYKEYAQEGKILDGFPVWPSLFPFCKKIIDID